MKRLPSYRILFFLITIHAVYAVAACYFKGIYLVDSYGYLMQADNLKAHGTWYAEDWNAPLLIDYFSIRPPLYAWFNIFLGWFSGSIYLVLFVQNLLSILNCWLVYQFVAKKTGITKQLNLAMIACMLFYPAQMIHANFVMTEILFQTLLLCLFFAVSAFMEQPHWKQSTVISVVLSLCLLTKPVSLFLPFIVLGFMLWSIAKHNQKWILTIPLLLTAMVFHGICKQNEHATGYYHYSSIKSINQLKYNARYTLVNAIGEQYADSVIAATMQQANACESYAERLKLMDTKAAEIIVEHPNAFAKLYSKGMVAFFLDPGRFDMYHFFAIEEKDKLGLMYEMQTKGLSAVKEYVKQAPVFVLLLLVLNFCWNSMVVYFFIRFLGTPNIPFILRTTIVVFVFYVAVATGPVGVSRYRVPVYPLLMIGVLYSAKLFPRNKIEHA